jgi:nucleotide-binding universal stress UspA family protein
MQVNAVPAEILFNEVCPFTTTEFAMFKNILIPTDGSEFSEKIVNDGMALAKTLHAKVTGVHVFSSYLISPYGEFGPSDDEVYKQMRAVGEREANRYLDRLQAAATSAGVEFDRVVLEKDHPWEGILEAAKKEGCDAIMMAAHGRSGLSALVLGSETNKVLTHSKIPVLVYH